MSWHVCHAGLWLYGLRFSVVYQIPAGATAIAITTRMWVLRLMQPHLVAVNTCIFCECHALFQTTVFSATGFTAGTESARSTLSAAQCGASTHCYKAVVVDQQGMLLTYLAVQCWAPTFKVCVQTAHAAWAVCQVFFHQSMLMCNLCMCVTPTNSTQCHCHVWLCTQNCVEAPFICWTHGPANGGRPASPDRVCW
jgi:hypothetical protein